MHEGNSASIKSSPKTAITSQTSSSVNSACGEGKGRSGKGPGRVRERAGKGQGRVGVESGKDPGQKDHRQLMGVSRPSACVELRREQ